MATRHGISSVSVMGSLMRHEGQTEQQAEAPTIQHPHWAIPRRGRGDAFPVIKGREGLGLGFSVFNDTTSDSLFTQGASARDGIVTHRQQTTIGDTARKHFEHRRGQEAPWRPSLRAAPSPEEAPKPRGRRQVPPIDAVVRHPHEEIGDIPRGKKHISPRRAAGEVEELELFSSKKRLVADERGVPCAWKGPPFFESTESTMMEGLRSRVQRTVGDMRNGIPCKVPGDLPYKKVEEAPGYVQAINPAAPRCGYEKPLPKLKVVDRFAQSEKVSRINRDVAEVRALPQY